MDGRKNPVLGLLVLYLVVELGACGFIEPIRSTPSIYDSCDDVAIIGGGVAGAYTAWRMRDLGHKITVYEFSNRVGGRMLTKHFQNIPDVNLDLGAWRFIPEEHTLLNRTLHDLGLPVVDFPNKMGHLHDTMVYFRGKHLSPRDLLTDKLPYNLRPEERNLSSPQLRRKLFVEKTSFGNSPVVSDHLDPTGVLNITTLDGIALFQQSDTVAYGKMSSAEAHRFLRDDSGFQYLHGAVSSAVSVPIGPQPTPWERENMVVKTIATGFSSLPNKLMEQFLYSGRRHKLRLNHQLLSIRSSRRGNYLLTFRRTRTIHGFTAQDSPLPVVQTCAKRVVLAVPRFALETIDWIGLKQNPVADYIRNAVVDVPATKIFLSYEEPWWREVDTPFPTSKSDLPNRWTYDIGTSAFSSRSVLLPAYMDMEDTNYWAELRKHGRLVPGARELMYSISTAIVDRLHHILATLHKIEPTDIPPVLGGMMSRWELYPFGGGWQRWAPGYDWNIVQDRMLRPLPTDDIYVVANAFSPGDASAWSNNALKYIQLLLERYGDRFRNVV